MATKTIRNGTREAPTSVEMPGAEDGAPAAGESDGRETESASGRGAVTFAEDLLEQALVCEVTRIQQALRTARETARGLEDERRLPDSLRHRARTLRTELRKLERHADAARSIVSPGGASP